MGLHSLPVPGRISVSPFGGDSHVHTHTYPRLSRYFLVCWAEKQKFKDIMYLNVPEVQPDRTVL